MKKDETQNTGKGYVIAICDASDFYIPNAEHIERNDDMTPWMFPDDDSATTAAEADGIRLIYGMPGVQDGVYIDSPKNRQTITAALAAQEEQQRIAQNELRATSDLPDCSRLFLKLENELGGKSGEFGEWLRISYELNEDFEDAPLEMAKGIYSAFIQVKEQYGNEIARSLYDSQSVVLANEIKSAGRYLSLGGQHESLTALANVGFFMESMENHTHDNIARVVSFINEGGSVNSAYDVLCQRVNDEHEQMGPAMTSLC